MCSTVLTAERYIPALHLQSGALSVCHEVRDLGIVVSDCLSPSAHVADVVGRAHRRAATRVHVARCQTVITCFYCLRETSLRI